MSSNQTQSDNSIKTCLKTVTVPQKLLEGVPVVKVHANGNLKNAFLTISEDNFTAYVTTSKLNDNRRFRNGKILSPLIRRVSSSLLSDDESENVRSIGISSINRIQVGHNTLTFELARKSLRLSGSEGKLNPTKSFSIIFNGSQSLNLMMPEEEDELNRDELLEVFNNLINTYYDKKKCAGNDIILLRHVWCDVDEDKSDTINSKEMKNLIDFINIQKDKKKICDEYEKFAKMLKLSKSERQKGLTFDQCATFLHKTKRDTWQVKPVHHIWIDLFGEFMNNGKPRNRVSAESFLKKFLWKKQGESTATTKSVSSTFEQLNHLELAKVSNVRFEGDRAGSYINKDCFEAYLLSIENDIFDPQKEKFDVSTMTRPLTEYWINSSHNTYLTGDQFHSKSSVEMYMDTLCKGCRCLEIDCWDGDKDVDGTPIPIVYHGHTMTSKILFRDVIQTISDFLNIHPDIYPVILSLENHCSIPYQEVMAQSLEVILGDRLYVPNEKALQQALPSPEELQGKIILKGRRLGGTLEYETFQTENDSVTDSEDEDFISVDVTMDDRDKLNPKISQSIKISPELSRLTLFHGVKLKSLGENSKLPCHHMHSFHESKTRKLCELQQNQWVSYNKTHMSRIFPAGKRVDSSNYSPIPGWSAGCQMVALNYQTNDIAMRLNHGRYRENGGCGYILKPSSLLKESVALSPMTLSIRVLCGSCLPKSTKGKFIDPYVKVSVHDIPPEGGRETIKLYVTSPAFSNGFCPIWNTEKFKFDVRNVDVAILQFSVWDKDVALSDEFIACSSVPISAIREGYRSVKLFDANHSQSGAIQCASLLVEVRIKKEKQLKMW